LSPQNYHGTNVAAGTNAHCIPSSEGMISYVNRQDQEDNGKMQVKRLRMSCDANRRTCLVHSVEVVGPAVGGGVRVLAVHPHGGNGGVASLRHHAPQRPRVREVASQDHVLHQHVPRLLRAFLASRGGGGQGRCIGRGGGGAHAGSWWGSPDRESE
jgi:hypothetical protein